jgi:hypothetical protein
MRPACLFSATKLGRTVKPDSTGIRMQYLYIAISLAMLASGITLLVRVFTRVKEPLFQMFLGVIGVGLILCAIGVLVAGIHH